MAFPTYQRWLMSGGKTGRWKKKVRGRCPLPHNGFGAAWGGCALPGFFPVDRPAEDANLCHCSVCSYDPDALNRDSQGTTIMRPHTLSAMVRTTLGTGAASSETTALPC